MGRLARLALQGLGVLVLAIVALSVIATVVGIAVSIVATIVSFVLTLAIVGGFLVALGWLASLALGAGDGDVRAESQPVSDPTERLRERYVAGELTEAEFERELEQLMDGDERHRERERSRH